MKKRAVRIKENLLNSVLSVLALTLIIIFVVSLTMEQKKLIGPIFIVLGIIHLLALAIFKIKVKAVLPDVVFGIIDNGILVIGAIIGAGFAGILGAIIGGSAANAITDGFAGIFEGWTAEYLRRHKIRDKRTALSSSIGKMAGCFLGAGIVLIIAWTILSL
jgi:type IV secretory pathway TrbL component